MAAFWRPWYNAGMNTDLPVPPQFAHMAKAACLVLLHPYEAKFAVCSRRDSDIYGLPGGKMDPGETMAETAVRETKEEVGVLADIAKAEQLFADAIPGEKDFWVETYIAVSPTTELVQMEPGITVKWTTWEHFLQRNAFKDYNDGVLRAYHEWLECRQQGKAYTMDTSHLQTPSATPEFPGY